jgi:2-polyprenyl-6-hydroxyphenyl methylase/3-demethylubiquinone-9 3-methyltransferase
MKQVTLSSTWSDEMRYAFEHDRIEWWDPELMPHRYNLYHTYIAMLLKLIGLLNPQRVLNVGCAQATLDLLLAEQGVMMTSVEIRPDFIGYAKLRYERGMIRWVPGNFFDVRFEEGTGFDLVMSHHAIEHVTEPLRFVELMAKYVRPGGHLLLTSPNHSYIRSRLPSFTEVGDLSLYPNFANSCDGQDHIFAFTRKELCCLGTSLGLKVEQHFYYESFLLAGHMKLWHLHQVLPGWTFNILNPLAALPLLNSALFQNQCVLFVKPSE